MVIDGYQSLPDCVTKFHNTVYVRGWFHHPEDELQAVRLVGADLVHQVSEANTPHGGVSAQLGENRGFFVQALFARETAIEQLSIEWTTRSRRLIAIPLMQFAEDRTSRFETRFLLERFKSLIEERQATSLLDIGGRDRSRVGKRVIFPPAETTVLDVIAADGVDVVGDAHRLSDYFPSGAFDAVYSCAVFEHLLMPWKVAIEMNHILKVGGIGLVQTHQTIGMHDLPWDFWRFSSDCWDAIFNKRTGFKIIARAMDAESYVLPFIYRPGKYFAERSVGFEGSAVIFEKTSETTLDWDVQVSDLVETCYPDVADYNARNIPGN
ncbi:MAG TPA: methyltransferase domain-containing protein [Methylocystis sp.]|nr:methyltransferase domain-containing protein [Methylocystis sp.]